MYCINFISERTKATVKEVDTKLERDSTGYFIRTTFTDGTATVEDVKCYVASDRLGEVKSIAGPPIHKLKGE